jgi:hypothetical protein
MAQKLDFEKTTTHMPASAVTGLLGALSLGATDANAAGSHPADVQGGEGGGEVRSTHAPLQLPGAGARVTLS